MANILLGMVMCSHSRSEDMLVHGAEAAMLARKDLPATDRGNPFWRYAAL